MPVVARRRAPPSKVRSDIGTEIPEQPVLRLVGKIELTLGERFLNIAKAQRETSYNQTE
jgi:hypothetical protein